MSLPPGPRIIAGLWRGRHLAAPAGLETRPTNARARQAVFDILAHAPWCELRGAKVLDVFAGTGAYGLEALSRGAESAVFFEQAAPALAALRANIAACKAADTTRVLSGDALSPPPGSPHELVFLDPPYGQNLVPKALAGLQARGWLARGAIIVAELGPNDALDIPTPLAERKHGKARVIIWQV